MFKVIDGIAHECLAIRISRMLKAIDVIDVLSALFAGHAGETARPKLTFGPTQ